MVETLALKIAKAIKKIEPDQTASVEILKFSLEFILNSLITLLVISAIGIFTGSIGQTLLGMAAFVLLRFFSGGLHLNKAMHCSLLTTVLIGAAPHIPLHVTGIWIATGISFVTILIFAPSNIEGHARIPKKYFPVLKAVSALIVLSNLIFMNPTISLVHLIQALTTISLKRR